MNNSRTILTYDGFNERFEENLRMHSIPQTKAYEITEAEHVKQFGQHRYSSYDSFRKVRNRKHRR